MYLSRLTALVAVSIVFLLNSFTTGQENAQRRLPKSLFECYSDSFLMQRDNLLPMTMSTLIELIRKIEDTPGFNQDMRQLSVSLIHRFRLDGIQRAADVQQSKLMIPYSAQGPQFEKHQFLLKRLLQGNANSFPNNTLSAVERCTLHAMLSSTFDHRIRGDESRCNQLAQYRSERVPRSLGVNSLNDVEILRSGKPHLPNRRSPMVEFEINDDMNDNMNDEGSVVNTMNNNDNDQGSGKSQCPVESGVIRTDWGTVAGGTLIQGIASGLQPINAPVPIYTRSNNGTNRNGRQSYYIDNKWAATLAGDLAELALRQGPYQNMEVGASGVWNSTALPKWYFLTQRNQLHITDAEIRGGIDGLIIASNVQQWRNMKLSQLLEMYYSQTGILTTGLRACDRKKNFIEYVPLEELKKQTTTLAFVLNGEIDSQGTMHYDLIKEYSDLAANKLSTYVPEKLNDPSCETTSPGTNGSINLDAATELYVFLDTSWEYKGISEILFYILGKQNVNEFGSKVTLLNANDGSIIVNTTDNLLDVMQGWNSTVQQQHGPGFNLPTVLRTIHNISMAQMLSEKQNSTVGGRSFIALLVPNTATVNEADTNYAVDYIWRLREEVPDLKFIYLAGGSGNRFAKFVQTEAKDIFIARPGDNIPNQSIPVIKRINEIHRRIINPKCGPSWDNGDYSQNQMTHEIGPGTVKYYRIISNYFFKEGGNRKLKIQGQGSSVIEVCSSRLNEYPIMNMPNKPEDLNCKQVTNNAFEIDLSNPCSGHSVIHQCPPYYVSVQAGKNSSQPSQCKDCRRPDAVKFLIQTDNLGCFSGVGTFIANSLLILLAFLSISYV